MYLVAGFKPLQPILTPRYQSSGRPTLEGDIEDADKGKRSKYVKIIGHGFAFRHSSLSVMFQERLTQAVCASSIPVAILSATEQAVQDPIERHRTIAIRALSLISLPYRGKHPGYDIPRETVVVVEGYCAYAIGHMELAQRIIPH